MVFPLFKLGSLFAKTALKPVSNGLKAYAQRSVGFRDSCYWVANSYVKSQNFFCQRLKIPYQATHLTTEQAVDLGVGMVGEGILLLGATGVLYYEYTKTRPASEESKRKFIEYDERLKKIEEQMNGDRLVAGGFFDTFTGEVRDFESRLQRVEARSTCSYDPEAEDAMGGT